MLDTIVEVASTSINAILKILYNKDRDRKKYFREIYNLYKIIDDITVEFNNMAILLDGLASGNGDVRSEWVTIKAESVSNGEILTLRLMDSAVRLERHVERFKDILFNNKNLDLLKAEIFGLNPEIIMNTYRHDRRCTEVIYEIRHGRIHINLSESRALLLDINCDKLWKQELDLHAKKDIAMLKSILSCGITKLEETKKEIKVFLQQNADISDIL